MNPATLKRPDHFELQSESSLFLMLDSHSKPIQCLFYLFVLFIQRAISQALLNNAIVASVLRREEKHLTAT